MKFRRRFDVSNAVVVVLVLAIVLDASKLRRQFFELFFVVARDGEGDVGGDSAGEGGSGA